MIPTEEKRSREIPLYFYLSPYQLQKYVPKKICKANDQITMALGHGEDNSGLIRWLNDIYHFAFKDFDLPQKYFELNGFKLYRQYKYTENVIQFKKSGLCVITMSADKPKFLIYVSSK